MKFIQLHMEHLLWIFSSELIWNWSDYKQEISVTQAQTFCKVSKM